MSRYTQTASHWGVSNVETFRDGSIGSATPFIFDQAAFDWPAVDTLGATNRSPDRKREE
jgi:hypothetical protein